MIKIVLIAGAALILGGGLVYGAAYAIGERRADARAASVTHTFPANRNISSMRINGMVARVNVRQGEGNELRIEAQDIIEEHFKYELDAGGTLTLSYSSRLRGRSLISLPMITRRAPVIDIYIPQGMDFENFDIDGGVGDFNIEYVSASSFSLDSGVGRVAVRGSRVGRLKINAGVGEIDINGEIGELEVDGGVGRVTVSGSVARDISVSGGVGEIKLDLAGDINNYDVRAEGGIGAIRVNGERANNFRNAGAPYNLTAHGGVGSISININ